MQFIRAKQLAACLALSALSCLAWGQYVWTDDKGVKQFSDMPPPASVPQSRILKQPSGRMPAAAAPASAEAEAGRAPKAPLTTAESNADFMKRRAEQAEKDKKAAAEAQAARDKASNCEKARSYQRALDSGLRIARTDKNGEREFMSDEQRSREHARNQPRPRRLQISLANLAAAARQPAFSGLFPFWRRAAGAPPSDPPARADRFRRGRVRAARYRAA